MPEDFPWLYKFLQNIFDQKQRDNFFAWWKRFYSSGSAGNLEQGQAIIIAGEAGRGKTLLSRVIVGSSVGGYADASRYLMGDSRFNKECGENALWVVDDSKSCATRAQASSIHGNDQSADFQSAEPDGSQISRLPNSVMERSDHNHNQYRPRFVGHHSRPGANNPRQDNVLPI